MDLVKVGIFTGEIEKLKEEITYIKKQITILHNIEWIEFEGNRGASRGSFTLAWGNDSKLEQPLEVFKTLALKELDQKKLDKEKELAELIKKGITDND